MRERNGAASYSDLEKDVFECDLKERRRGRSNTSIVQWISTLLSRSPRAINERRARLLPKSRSSSRSPSCSRHSSDIESQASTLLDTDRHDNNGKSKSSSTSPMKLDPRIISDAIIGLSDGLTVPFALTAGLSALDNTSIVIFAGLAELTAGAISMGLGGYLAAKSEDESYKATLHDTRKQVAYGESLDTAQRIREVFEPYDLPESLEGELIHHLAKQAESEKLVQFLMQFQHGAPEQASSRALVSGMTIACGYFIGGLLPLLPYFMVGKDQVMLALWWSFVFMGASLFGFGYGKTCFVSGWTGRKNMQAGIVAGLQMMLVGGTAAVCAMTLVRLFDSLAT